MKQGSNLNTVTMKDIVAFRDFGLLHDCDLFIFVIFAAWPTKLSHSTDFQ